MRKILMTLSCILFVALMTLPANAAARVICQVTYTSDHSANVQLKWSDPSVKTPLMISSWKFEDSKTLTVYYKSGKEVLPGWDSRTITHDTYMFPMKLWVAADQATVLPLKDVSTAHKSYGAIMNLYHRGIISGYLDGNFKGNLTVTRAEFSKMLLLTANYTQVTTMKSTFKDLKDTHWARNYVMTLATKGILQGKGDQKFDPEGSITVGEVLTVLSRTFNTYQKVNGYGYTLGTHWSNLYFLDAVEKGMVIKGDSFYNPYTPNQKATREMIAVLLSRVLEQLYEVEQ
jgi:hypothetical protein